MCLGFSCDLVQCELRTTRHQIGCSLFDNSSCAISSGRLTLKSTDSISIRIQFELNLTSFAHYRQASRCYPNSEDDSEDDSSDDDDDKDDDNDDGSCNLKDDADAINSILMCCYCLLENSQP